MDKIPFRIRNDKGYTLLGIVVILAIAGLLVGWVFSLMRTAVVQELGSRTSRTLTEARKVLFVPMGATGKLPFADTDGNGSQNSEDPTANFVGDFPYRTLGVVPADEWGRRQKYHVNPSLVKTRYTSCTSLKAGLGGSPELQDWVESAGATFPVAAIVLSAGPANADQTGGVFDASGGGNNGSGNPSYVNAPPTATYDDLVTYIRPDTLYAWLTNPAYVNQSDFNWTTCIAPHCINGVLDSDEASTDRGGNDCVP